MSVRTLKVRQTQRRGLSRVFCGTECVCTSRITWNDLKRLKSQGNDRKTAKNYSLDYEKLKTPVMIGDKICGAGCNRIILRNSAETVKLGGKPLCYNGDLPPAFVLGGLHILHDNHAECVASAYKRLHEKPGWRLQAITSMITRKTIWQHSKQW